MEDGASLGVCAAPGEEGVVSENTETGPPAMKEALARIDARKIHQLFPGDMTPLERSRSTSASATGPRRPARRGADERVIPDGNSTGLKDARVPP